VLSASYRFQDNLQNSDRAVTNFVNNTASGYPGSYLLTGRPLTSTGGHVVIGGNDYTALYDANKAANGTLKVVDPNCGAAGTNSVYSPTGGASFGLGNCLYNFQPKNPIRPRARSVNIHDDSTFEINDANTIFPKSATTIRIQTVSACRPMPRTRAMRRCPPPTPTTPLA
jgi:iron complex outermembrane receptor protein